MNKNIPAMLSRITGAFAHINISDMINKSKRDYAYKMIDVDSEFDIDEMRKKLSFEGIIAVRVIIDAGTPAAGDNDNDGWSLKPYSYFA